MAPTTGAHRRATGARSHRGPPPYPSASCLCHVGGAMDDRALGRSRGAGAQRRGGPGGFRPSAARLPQRALPVRLAHRHRRQRVDRRHPGSRSSTRRGAAGVEVSRFRRRVRAGAAGRLDGLERGHRRLHGRRSLDGVDGAAPARRTARLGALGRGRRFSSERRIRRRSRAQARAHLAALQPDAPPRLRRSLPGCAVRIQSGAH